MAEVQDGKPKQFKANLPTDVFGFLNDQSLRFGSSVNSEIIRAVRERMERVETKTASEPCKTPLAV